MWSPLLQVPTLTLLLQEGCGLEHSAHLSYVICLSAILFQGVVRILNLLSVGQKLGWPEDP